MNRRSRMKGNYLPRANTCLCNTNSKIFDQFHSPPPPSYPVVVATDFWFSALLTVQMACYIVAIIVQVCILFFSTCIKQEFSYNSGTPEDKFSKSY